MKKWQFPEVRWWIWSGERQHALRIMHSPQLDRLNLCICVRYGKLVSQWESMLLEKLCAMKPQKKEKKKADTLWKYEASSYQSDLIPPLLSLHGWFGAHGPASWMMSRAPHSGEDDINGGEMRGWEDIGRWVAWPGYLCQSYVMVITGPPRQRCEDSQPRSTLQLGVSFTNSHLSPLGFSKRPTNVEGSAKCAQSCQAWPRSDGQTESAGSAACVASWMPKCQGP